MRTDARDIARRAAYAEFGRRHYRWYVFGPLMRRALFAALVLGALLAAWSFLSDLVSARMLVVGAGSVAVLAVVVFVVGRVAQGSAWGARLSYHRGRYIGWTLVATLVVVATTTAFFLERHS